MSTLSKRERLQRLCAGEKADRPGVALWRHWPGDDQIPEELAQSTLSWQQQFDWDFVKVSPSSHYGVYAWGARSQWLGNNEGNRQYTYHPIQQEADWFALRPQDPRAGMLGEQIRGLQIIGDALPRHTPFIQTIFSPTAQLKYLAGKERVLAEIRLHPDAVHHALHVITQTTLDFLQAIRATGVAGIFYAVQLCSPQYLTWDEYERFGLVYDSQIMQAANELFWFNLLHLHGAGAYFQLASRLPVQAVNWHDREGPPSLAEARQQFSGALVGGLHHWDSMLRGTPQDVWCEATDAIEQTDGRGLILATGCVTMITSPLGNIRAARKVVDVV